MVDYRAAPRIYAARGPAFMNGVSDNAPGKTEIIPTAIVSRSLAIAAGDTENGRENKNVELSGKRERARRLRR